MSTARLILSELAKHAGPVKLEHVTKVLGGQTDGQAAVYSLEALDLVRRCGRGHWQITERGRDLSEGRVEIRRVRLGRYLASTWLASLPRDIQINRGSPE